MSDVSNRNQRVGLQQRGPKVLDSGADNVKGVDGRESSPLGQQQLNSQVKIQPVMKNLFTLERQRKDGTNQMNGQRRGVANQSAVSVASKISPVDAVTPTGSGTTLKRPITGSDQHLVSKAVKLENRSQDGSQHMPVTSVGADGIVNHKDRMFNSASTRL